MGVVSPVGNGVAVFWDALCRGLSGVREITSFDTDGFPCSRGGEVRDFVLPDPICETASNWDRATQFMAAAACEAVGDASLEGTGEPQLEIGVVLSTNFGGILSGEKVLAQVCGHGQAGPGDFTEYAFQSCADHVADIWKLSGPRVVLSLSCSSGTAALGIGAGLIRAGRAKAVLTGGYDALSRFAWSGLGALHTMTHDEIRPFDKNRKGTIFSEGAGAVVIEDAEQARKRGAPIYAELAGCGMNNNAHHMTAPAKGGAGSATVMRMALEDAGMEPAKVDHINTHGTGTRFNDVAETQAVKEVFGTQATRIPLTSIKSMTGHMMGAAGSVEAIASVMSIREGCIPPTINFSSPDPECDLDVVVGSRREQELRTVLSNSAGIGGCNAAAILTGGKRGR